MRTADQGRGITAQPGDLAEGSAATGLALLDYQQFAAWLNDSVRHLRRLVSEERIPHIKVGHFVRFDPAEIAEWLKANRRGVA
jgi:excisionase family DNA binding protein